MRQCDSSTYRVAGLKATLLILVRDRRKPRQHRLLGHIRSAKPDRGSWRLQEFNETSRRTRFPATSRRASRPFTWSGLSRFNDAGLQQQNERRASAIGWIIEWRFHYRTLMSSDMNLAVGIKAHHHFAGNGGVDPLRFACVKWWERFVLMNSNVRHAFRRGGGRYNP